MALSIKDFIIIKIVQAICHQGDVRYSIFRVVYCSCLFLTSVGWTLLKSPGHWGKFDLDCILGKGDQLFEYIGKFRYLGI